MMPFDDEEEQRSPGARWAAIVAQLKRSNERIALLEERVAELKALVDILMQEPK